MTYLPERSTAKRRVYKTSDKEEAVKFIEKYKGSFFEYLPELYFVII